MHHEVLEYVGSQFFSWKLNQLERPLKILEFGSLDINGSVRGILQQHAEKYVGVDMQGGPGVDIICDATSFMSHDKYDVVVCAEVFEHTPHWRHIINNSHKHLAEGGLFIATMAGEGRRPHSAIDENPIREWEYYDNVGVWELQRALKIFSRFETNTLLYDLRCWAVR